jgi:hypothetical protein
MPAPPAFGFAWRLLASGEQAADVAVSTRTAYLMLQEILRKVTVAI